MGGKSVALGDGPVDQSATDSLNPLSKKPLTLIGHLSMENAQLINFLSTL